MEPAFERLGPDATPDQVLDLKVCDPAMGSGAFLVEACRAIGERLVKAWERWPETRPKIPADEDEELHARRLVAQRCLYGVDKNPRAVDLARLSLWLATLAKDHEFTFLDHALKCGDSLVGLTREQITSLHWDRSGGLPLFGSLVRERFEAAVNGRREIREAPDDVTRAIQEVRFRQVESRLDNVRLIANAIVAAFFSADKPRAREAKRQEIESWANGPTAEMWPKLKKLAETLRSGVNTRSCHFIGKLNSQRSSRERMAGLTRSWGIPRSSVASVSPANSGTPTAIGCRSFTQVPVRMWIYAAISFVVRILLLELMELSA